MDVYCFPVNYDFLCSCNEEFRSTFNERFMNVQIITCFARRKIAVNFNHKRLWF